MSLQSPPTDRIALITITLDDIKPAIWRRIEVPLGMTLLTLHEVIQAVMLFEDCHLFRFDVGERGGERHYGIPDPEDVDVINITDAGTVTLGQFIEAGVKRMVYTYDFGDDWRHTITVDATGAGNPARLYPRFVEGARRAPPEDVGGLPGFEAFLQAMAKPRHRESKDVVEWYGGVFDPTDIGLTDITDRLAALVRPNPLPKLSPGQKVATRGRKKGTP